MIRIIFFIALIVVIVFLVRMASRGKRESIEKPENNESPVKALLEAPKVSSVKIEEQIRQLDAIGIRLNDGIEIDDLLYSYTREEYEEKPFDLILFMYGSEVEREPWGRSVSDSAWNFDMESIEGDGSYLAIVRRLALLANKDEQVTDISDTVNFDSGEAWVSYKLNGVLHRYDIQLNDDWADSAVTSAIMNDLTDETRQFYAIDNGQASIWFFLDEAQARQLNELTRDALIGNIE